MKISEKQLAVLPPPAREAFLVAHEKALSGDDYELRTFAALRDYPVPIEEFVESPDYLNSDAVYPRVLEELVELNNPLIDGCEFRARLWTLYSEAILTGPIGTGKTTIALISILYQLYVLSCFRDPHVPFELDPSSEIVFAFQNKTERLAKAVDFDRFRAMVSSSPYFREQFPFDRRVKSELRFPSRIIVKPVAGTSDAVIGQNVFGGIIDEVNFMELVGRSARSHDGREYDQAMSLYLSIARRRASRFMRHGRLPGLLCLVSSRRYPGQFTDRKEAERRRQIAESGATTIYLYDKRAWEIKPPGTYCGDVFRVFKGDEARQPRILDEGGELPPEDRPGVVEIPVEHRREFEDDILNALRDIAGVNTLAVRMPDLGAGVPFYGSQARAEDVPRIQAPLMIQYAGLDQRINAGWPAFEAALKANDKTYVMHMYEGVNHGFHNDTTPRYDEAAATLAQDRTMAFFDEHLR